MRLTVASQLQMNFIFPDKIYIKNHVCDGLLETTRFIEKTRFFKKIRQKLQKNSSFGDKTRFFTNCS